MFHRRSGFRGLIIVALASLVVAGCGSASSGSASPNTLLSQTFTGTHKVTSGNVNLTLTINPSGSSLLSSPITVSFGGPFQSLGAGKLPESNFVVSASALGQNVALGIISTGTAGYVTFQGGSYQMPAATFQKLESSFGQLASTPGANSGTLGKLGIQPLHWLTNPSVVGTESVGGAQTTHIHAGVNVNALLTDLNTILEKASALGGSTTSSLRSGMTAAQRTKIAAEIKNPSVDIWTGTNDKTLRRLTINVTLPVSGKTSSQLGGLTSANITLTLQYSDLNQPQTIKPPTTVLPFSQFQSKLNAFIQTLQGAASGVLGGSSSSSGSSSGSSGATTTGSSASVAKYSQCIQSAKGDVAKMQKCASLLGGG